MNELRKNNTVKIELRNGVKLDGIVLDHEIDRVLILIAYESLNIARSIKELDKLLVSVKTHMGIKNMFSHVIEPLNKHNCIIVENNESIPIEQKREYVRVYSDFNFTVSDLDNNSYTCNSENISAGGIAFRCNDKKFNIGDKVKLVFPESEFGKEISCVSDIIKSLDNIYVAKYYNLNSFDEDRIVKYVFKMIAMQK